MNSSEASIWPPVEWCVSGISVAASATSESVWVIPCMGIESVRTRVTVPPSTVVVSEAVPMSIACGCTRRTV